MKKRLLTIFALTVGLLAFSEAANAQFSALAVGPHAGFDFDGSDLFIGGNVIVPTNIELAGASLAVNGDASYWITGDGYSLFVIDGNMLYPISLDSESLSPYVGAGLVISFFSADVDCGSFCDLIDVDGASSTDFGVNLKGGAEFGTNSMKPFGEVGFYLKDGSTFYVQGGVRFILGGS
jgi:hypothetical protein